VKELRVPTIATAAEVTLADGRVLSGRVFLPAAAFRHAGPMRPEEWINEPAAFFPFLPEREDEPLLLNKDQVVVIGLVTPAVEEEEPVPAGDGVREVQIDCGALRLEGELRIDMPEGQRRVLDTLNRPERFLALRAGRKHHLVHKRHINRVLEKRGR
jgi:hypothetical protein